MARERGVSDGYCCHALFKLRQSIPSPIVYWMPERLINYSAPIQQHASMLEKVDSGQTSIQGMGS